MKTAKFVGVGMPGPTQCRSKETHKRRARHLDHSALVLCEKREKVCRSPRDREERQHHPNRSAASQVIIMRRHWEHVALRPPKTHIRAYARTGSVSLDTYLYIR